MRSALTTLTLMLVASSPAWAETPTASTDLFVAPHGSDAGPGTKEQPFETIAHARDVVRDLIAAGLTSDVSNNHVHACGVEYFGAIGIWVGFARQAAVSHNLVYDLPYSGISLGWQWNPQPTPCKENIIEYNHVYDVMNRLCDGGCIYTLGFQPGTVIRGNHLHDVHRSRYAQGAPNNGMFIDQGSKGFLFENNVIYNTAAELVRFNQCARDWHTWRNNHFGQPAEVKESGKDIIAKAGLQPPYRDRLTP